MKREREDEVRGAGGRRQVERGRGGKEEEEGAGWRRRGKRQVKDAGKRIQGPG